MSVTCINHCSDKSVTNADRCDLNKNMITCKSMCAQQSRQLFIGASSASSDLLQSETKIVINTPNNFIIVYKLFNTSHSQLTACVYKNTVFKMNIVILPIIYLLLINNLCNAAYIFGYMLHNPIASEGMAMMSDEPTVQNDTRIKCKIDSDCDSDMYCDSHYGYCGHLLEEGELCRRDEQCRKKHICIFGNCELPSKPGHKGSRCKGDDDCKPNLCCARQHGEKICKSKLQKGNRCFVPLGGLDYSLNELCPCTEGLVCTKHKRKHRKRMSETDHLRCHPSNTSIE